MKQIQKSSIFRIPGCWSRSHSRSKVWVYTQRAFLMHAFCCGFSGLPNVRKTRHIKGKQRVFLLYVFWHESLDCETAKNSCHTECKIISSHQCEFLYVLSCVLSGKNSFHIEGMCIAFSPYECLYESSDFLYGQKPFHIEGRGCFPC